VNIYLRTTAIEVAVQSLLNQGVAPPSVAAERVVVDYSSPNIAKNMHVGHLRSTILGDVISRVLEFCGHEVLRVNHVGDWGTQFGMLIAYLKEKYPDCRENPPNIVDLGKFYAASKERFSSDKAFEKIAHEEVVKLQSGDPENRALWKVLYDVSEQMFNRIYKRLGISDKLKLCGESFYQSRVDAVIQEMEAKGCLQEHEGMKICPIEGEKVPLIVRKSNGGIGYDSTDITAIRYRFEELGAKRIVYVVDAGQELHFRLVFKAAKKMGWMEDGRRAEHMKFGLVLGEDGKRIRSRDGGTISLSSLLDEARDRTIKALKERAASGEGRVAAKDLKTVAGKVGYASVKYFDLSRERIKDYKFNYNQILAPDGDTAVYLQYSHARMCSIIRKVGKDISKLKASSHLKFRQPQELALGLQLLDLPNTLQVVDRKLEPHHLCKWMRDVCVRFSNFFQSKNCHVVGTAEEDHRLLLVQATVEALRLSANLMGFDMIEHI